MQARTGSDVQSIDCLNIDLCIFAGSIIKKKSVMCAALINGRCRPSQLCPGLIDIDVNLIRCPKKNCLA